jgi:predicted ABC-type ATPase
MESRPTLILLAGPNGAVKTTFYEAHLKDKGLPFINADRMVTEWGIDAYEAARMAQTLRNRFIEESRSFISETVFSDPVGEKISMLERAASLGFEVTLIFIGLNSVALSRKRVETRVRAGGHPVPPGKLKGRYERSLSNLNQAVSRLARVIVYDNSRKAPNFRFLFWFEAGSLIRQTKAALPAWARDLAD